MAIDYQAPENLDRGGAFLEQAGTYHFCVQDTNEQPTDKGGKLIDGFQVTASVLAGTVDGQAGKQIDLTFFNPKLTDKNGGEFAKKKQGRFLTAVGLLSENKSGAIELSHANGRQFIATLEHKTDKDTGQPTKFLQLHFADIWHVDDPEAASYPKCQKSLGLLPANLRRKSETFTASNGNGKSKSANSQQPVGAGAGTGMNLDNL